MSGVSRPEKAEAVALEAAGRERSRPRLKDVRSLNNNPLDRATLHCIIRFFFGGGEEPWKSCTFVTLVLSWIPSILSPYLE